jgi:large repetitive protein
VTPSGTRVFSMNFNDPSTDPAAPAPTLFSYRMTPVPLNLLSVAQMRAGMDAMHVKSPAPPSVVPSGSGQMKLTWKPPARTVASAVTGYVVTPYIGNVAQPAHTFHSTLTSQFIGGLKNGTAYQFAVAAAIGPGTGYRSVKSGKVVAGAPGQPGKPTVVKTATGGLVVTFAPPSNNGAKITSYTVACTSAKGGRPKIKGAAALSITVKGLTVGTAYTCTVKAANKRGLGPTSRPSKATTA